MRRDRAAQLAVFAAAFLAFLPALRCAFVNWDDDWLILSNPAARGFGWTQLEWAFGHYVGLNYAPLTWLSYGLDRLVWGIDPRGYHLTNLLLHAANAVLFYRLSKILLDLARPSSSRREGYLVAAALLSALLFAVHPLRAESVVWASERRDVLSGFFYLCAILLYLRSSRAALPAYALSLLSKGMGVTLPAVLLMLDVYPLRRIGRMQDLWSSAGRRVLAEKAPFAALAAAAALVGIKGQAQMAIPVAARGPAASLVQSLYGFSFYLWKTVWPFRLSPIYELPLGFDPFSFPYAFGALSVVALSVVLWLKRRTRPAALAAWIFFIVTLLPVSGFVQLGLQIAADRYTYLSTLGFALLAGGALLSLLESDSVRERGVRFLAVVLPGILAGLAVLSWRQARVWRDSGTLWSYALALAPGSSAAHSGMADVLRDQGRIDAAIGEYREALRINPNRSRPRNNLGLALVARGELDEGILQYRAALDLWPEGDAIHNNLGLALARRGKMTEAAAEFRQALALNPGFTEAHSNLGAALAATGRLTEALEQYREALRLDPNDVDAACSLGLALVAQGNWEESYGYFRRALAASPEPARLYERLLLALNGQGAGADGLRLFRANVAAPSPQRIP